MPEVSIRPGTVSDAAAVARIWATGWLDGHLGNVPEELVRARTHDSFRTRAPERVADTAVAEVDGELAGFVMVVGDEVEQVYVDPAHRGSGIAGTLLTEAERRVAANGHECAWLAVAAGNDRAKRFYEKQGWTDDGVFEHAAPVVGGSIPVTCHRMVKDVTGPGRR
jgi:ribosomal protein S18 acetylase RimI-like enzyme